MLKPTHKPLSAKTSICMPYKINQSFVIFHRSPRWSQREHITAVVTHPGQSSAADCGTSRPKKEPILPGIRGRRKEMGFSSHPSWHHLMLKQVNKNYVFLISQGLPQQYVLYSIAGKTDSWVQGTESGRIGSALACEFRAVQLLRPRDEKRQIGEQRISNITVSFRGIFKADQRCFYATS